MDEERLTVLRMIAEGKITAEEGERLLEALGPEGQTATPPKQPPKVEQREQEETRSWREQVHQAREQAREARERAREQAREAAGRGGLHIPPIPPMPPMPDFGKIMPDFGKIVNNAMKGVFAGTLAPESQELSVPEGVRRLMVVCSGGGDLTISDTGEATLKIEGRCSVSTYGEEARIDERDGNDVTLSVPASILSIHALNVGGGDIHCRLGSAEGRKIALEAPGGGDAFASVGKIAESTINIEASGGGDIALRVPEDAAFEITMQAPGGGDVYTDLPLEASEKTASGVKGQRSGGGTSRISLSAPGGGDVRLLKLE